MFIGGSTIVINPNIHEMEREGASNSQELDPQRSGENEEDQAVPPWMRVLLGRTPDSPEAMKLQEQLDAATKMNEMHSAKKAENLDTTGERATKHERELLLQREDETLGLELNKKGVTPGYGGVHPEYEIETARMAVLIQKAYVAGQTALIQGDFQATQRFFLTCHHASCIIAGDSYRHREKALISEQYKAVLSKDNNIFAVFGRESKEKIKEYNNILKLITPTSETTPAVQITPVQSQQSSEQISNQVASQIPQPQFQMPNNFDNQSRFIDQRQQRNQFFQQGLYSRPWKRNKFGFIQNPEQQFYQQPQSTFYQQPMNLTYHQQYPKYQHQLPGGHNVQ